MRVADMEIASAGEFLIDLKNGEVVRNGFFPDYFKTIPGEQVDVLTVPYPVRIGKRLLGQEILPYEIRILVKQKWIAEKMKFILKVDDVIHHPVLVKYLVHLSNIPLQILDVMENRDRINKIHFPGKGDGGQTAGDEFHIRRIKGAGIFVYIFEFLDPVLRFEIADLR